MAFLKQSVSKNVLFRSMSTCSKLFVGGHELSLKEAFSQYGEVVEGITSSEAASSAIQALDSQDLHGRQIRVNFATETGGYGGSGGGGYGSPLADFDPTKGDFHVDTTSGLGEIPSGPRSMADYKSAYYNLLLLDKMVDESDDYDLQKKIDAQREKELAMDLDMEVNEIDDNFDNYSNEMLSDMVFDDILTMLNADLPPENEGGY